MSKMNDACKKVLDSVGSAYACGVVDLERKAVLEIVHVPQFSDAQQKMTTQAIMHLFRGTNARQLANQVHVQIGKASTQEKGFREIQMAFQENFYFSTTIKAGRAALILVTPENTNIGMAWVQLKSVIPIIEPLIP